jgi:4-phospho-D-threonate 3-dehydrogenase / 4-phospho-D-erythronate 3-dehydrogenase
MRRPIVGVTMGDAAGIGPEIILKAYDRAEVRAAADYLVYGSLGAMESAVPCVGWKGRLRRVSEPGDCRFESGVLEVIECGELPQGSYRMGQLSAVAGELAFQAIRRAIEDALAGRIDATATAPINKEALALAGRKFAGHTEIYAHYTGTKDYTMLLMEGALRVAHVSTHVSLLEAISLVKKERIVSVLRLLHDALVGMGIDEPRIAVAGLNPHAGEGGLFGREEIDEIAPAVKAAADLGALGPFPPDTVFSRAAGGEYDAVVAMYHDQGHIPLKMAGFRYGGEDGPKISGINVTLGTPVIRCSVDHGTAFDRAGKGVADEGSMCAAMMAAAGAARSRKA